MRPPIRDSRLAKFSILYIIPYDESRYIRMGWSSGWQKYPAVNVYVDIQLKHQKGNTIRYDTIRLSLCYAMYDVLPS